MLISPDDSSPITNIPLSRQHAFSTWRSRLSAAEYGAIVAHLNNKISKDTIHNSSWLAAPEWEGTPLQVIYTKACRMDEEAAAKFFGLIVWETMIDRLETWSFTRIEGDDRPEGMTYFRA